MDSEWEDLVAIVVEWLQTSPNINMDIMLALWLDTDGCNLMNSFKVSLFVLIMSTKVLTIFQSKYNHIIIDHMSRI